MMGISRKEDSVGQRSNGKLTLKLVLAGLGILATLVMIPMFAPVLVQGVLATPTILVILIFSVAVFTNIMTESKTKTTAAEKQKRGLEGLDMYSMIDRLVDDLDEDELDYLRRRLEQPKPAQDRELAHSLEALLDERSEAKAQQR